MEEKKKKFNFNTGTYKPNIYKPKMFGKQDMDDGLKKALGEKQELKPLNISGQQRKAEVKQVKFDIGSKKEEKKAEPEAYWTTQQWEEWAYQLYKNYPDTHEYLPDWFLEAMEEE